MCNRKGNILKDIKLANYGLNGFESQTFKRPVEEDAMLADEQTERREYIMSLGADDCRGSSLMLDFGGTFLDIMKNGGKTVLFVYKDDVGGCVNEAWFLRDDRYVCENKSLSYTLEEFIACMDKEECTNIDVFSKDELKIKISSL